MRLQMIAFWQLSRPINISSPLSLLSRGFRSCMLTAVLSNKRYCEISLVFLSSFENQTLSCPQHLLTWFFARGCGFSLSNSCWLLACLDVCCCSQLLRFRGAVVAPLVFGLFLPPGTLSTSILLYGIPYVTMVNFVNWLMCLNTTLVLPLK